MRDADLLLDEALRTRDPNRFRVLADFLEEHGEARMAWGWRQVADWMELPFGFDADDRRLGSNGKVRWPRTDKTHEWWFWTDPAWSWIPPHGLRKCRPGNGIPGLRIDAIFPSEKAAMLWLCRRFSRRKVKA